MLLYRPEIDGLRAIAVVAVILFHAGFDLFGGGFVGVDVFFVISGYLITRIILLDLENDRFSITKFYERRARRILPALFFVMLMSLIFGLFLLMPDELKNLGQSLVATALFANNVLLAFTSGYWDLASEFKPLLHTWSLAVEEQYYLIIPIFFLLLWKADKKLIPQAITAVTIGSITFASWLGTEQPDWAFYSLPTRAWELGVGSLAAVYAKGNVVRSVSAVAATYLSATGLGLILGAVLFLDSSSALDVYPLLLPITGAVLVITFCQPDSAVYRILSNKYFVSTGLLSYSLYLWHQPAFAYLRAWSKVEPNKIDYLLVMPFVFLASLLTWALIERPFRNTKAISRQSLIAFASGSAIFFILVGLYLNATYGIPERAFGKDVKTGEMDKRVYNERVFSFKNDAFQSISKIKVLVVGNSFARDFVNITLETFDVTGVEIIYRDDLGQCIDHPQSPSASPLFFSADVVVFGSGSYRDCYQSDLELLSRNGKQVFYVGTKNFGYNLNWLIHVDPSARANRYNRISEQVLAYDQRMSLSIPNDNFISLIKPVILNGQIPITDHKGRMLTTDRQHLTRYGAIYFGQKSVRGSRYSEIFAQSPARRQ